MSVKILILTNFGDFLSEIPVWTA